MDKTRAREALYNAALNLGITGEEARKAWAAARRAVQEGE